MRKSITLFKLLTVLTLLGGGQLLAQIEGLDASKYYKIINKYSGNAIGVDTENLTLDGAVVQQHAADSEADEDLWEIREVTDSTYTFINKGTGMALGASEWFGTNPFYSADDGELEASNFVWNGSHRGVCQRAIDGTDLLQVWKPSPFSSGATTDDELLLYRMVSTYEPDSTLAFNLWAKKTSVGRRNIALFPGVLESTFDDATSGYAHYFVATEVDVPKPTAVSSLEEMNIIFPARANAIEIQGDIDGEVIRVYSVVGSLVKVVEATASVVNIPVEPGVYLVKIGDAAVKKLFVQ